MKAWIYFNGLEKVLWVMDYMHGTETTWNTKGQKRVFNWFKL